MLSVLFPTVSVKTLKQMRWSINNHAKMINLPILLVWWKCYIPLKSLVYRVLRQPIWKCGLQSSCYTAMVAKPNNIIAHLSLSRWIFCTWRSVKLPTVGEISQGSINFAIQQTLFGWIFVCVPSPPAPFPTPPLIILFTSAQGSTRVNAMLKYYQHVVSFCLFPFWCLHSHQCNNHDLWLHTYTMIYSQNLYKWKTQKQNCILISKGTTITQDTWYFHKSFQEAIFIFLHDC